MATTELEETLQTWFLDYLRAKRSLAFGKAILLRVRAGRRVLHEFATDMLTAFIDGVILELCIVVEWMKPDGCLGELLRREPEALSRERWLDWPRLTDERRNRFRPEYETSFDLVFPEVVARGEVVPTPEDLARLHSKLVAVTKPLRDHRHTLVAHRDREPKPATLEQIESAIESIDPIIEGLYFLGTSGGIMDLVNEDPERVADRFVPVMVF